MTPSNVVKIPCEAEGFYLARNVLRDPNATNEQIAAACDVLAASDDWVDIRMVRNARNVLWSVPGSETGDNFRRLDSDEMASIGLPSRRVMVRPDLHADFTEAASDSAADLRKLFFPGCLVALAGLAIGYLLQVMWGVV